MGHPVVVRGKGEGKGEERGGRGEGEGKRVRTLNKLKAFKSCITYPSPKKLGNSSTSSLVR